MLMFTLVISCLTDSNLPWFMDLTIQVPMQYCSLQHQILLASPLHSTTECCLCFGFIPSFFLELCLHWSPGAYWAPTNLESSSFTVLSFSPYHIIHGVLKARILKKFAIRFFSGPYSVRSLHHDPSVLGGPTWHAIVIEDLGPRNSGSRLGDFQEGQDERKLNCLHYWGVLRYLQVPEW